MQIEANLLTPLSAEGLFRAMKKLLLPLLLLGSGALAQGLDLPDASPAAEVMQRMGLTDVTVDYSSPGVKGRDVFGALVPYGQVWRTGANAATTIEFSEDVKIGGKDVPKGKYGLLTIPGKDSWTWIVTRSLNVTSPAAYKQDQDVARVTAKPETIPARERLSFIFDEFTDDRGLLTLEWATTKVALPIELGTAAQAKKNIEQTLGRAWQDYMFAARHTLQNKGDLNQALGWVNQSLSLQPHWWNNWVKAQILHAQGKTGDALVFARKAKELGSKNPQGFFFAREVDKAINEWSPKRK